jgi:outer membrane cobalamin receptor
MNTPLFRIASLSTLAALLVLAGIAPIAAQDKERPKEGPPPAAGSAVPDSTRKARPDTVLHFYVRRWAGSMMLSADTARAITATDIEWQTPVSLSDVVANVSGVFMADPSSIGQYVRPYTRGIDWRGTVVMVDGIPMSDPSAGAINLSMIPAGMADRIETAIGTRSFVYGTGATGAAINIVRPRVSRVTPVTRIRYEESDYSYATSDGMFVQDISQRVNVQVGYQYQGTSGRFDNSGHEQWNFRTDVRYHPVKNWDLTAHYMYTQTQTGLNEGIDFARTGTSLAFSTQQAIVRNPDAYEKVTRHDISLQLSGSLTNDSSALTSVSAYRSQLMREYRDEENRAAPNGLYLAEDHRIARTGLQIRQRFDRDRHNLTLGLFLDDQRTLSGSTMGTFNRTTIAGSFISELAFGGKNAWAVYGRVDNAGRHMYFGGGSDIRLSAGDMLTFTAGAAVMERPPTFTEPIFWGKVMPTLMFDNKERHLLFEAGVEIALGHVGTARINYGYRTIRNFIGISSGLVMTSGVQAGDTLRPWIFLQASDEESRIHSLDVELTLRIAWFTIEGTAGLIRWEKMPDIAMDEPPRGYARGGIYYRNRILSGALELQAGVRAQVRGRYYGATVLSRDLLPLTNTSTQLGAASTLDLVLIGHIGDAYVHVLWENVTDVQYFTTPFTPALGQRFRFGVSWEFLN